MFFNVLGNPGLPDIYRVRNEQETARRKLELADQASNDDNPVNIDEYPDNDELNYEINDYILV